MTQYLQVMFQFLPQKVAYVLLAVFTVLVILVVARLVKIVLDALPFV